MVDEQGLAVKFATTLTAASRRRRGGSRHRFVPQTVTSHPLKVTKTAEQDLRRAA